MKMRSCDINGSLERDESTIRVGGVSSGNTTLHTHPFIDDLNNSLYKFGDNLHKVLDILVFLRDNGTGYSNRLL